MVGGGKAESEEATVLAFTRKTDYALVAMAELARRVPSLVSAREISQSVRVPLPVLTNILHRLLRRGLVVSTRGPRGGYRLARGPERISLDDLIEAIEGPFRLALCCPSRQPLEDQTCDLESTCRIRGSVRQVHRTLHQFLSGVTLDQIICDTVPSAVDLSVAIGQKASQPAMVVDELPIWFDR